MFARKYLTQKCIFLVALANNPHASSSFLLAQHDEHHGGRIEPVPRRRVTRRSPLPQRYGVDAVRVALPPGTQSIAAYLMERFPRSAADVEHLFDNDQVRDDCGAAMRPTDPCAGRNIWYHRPLAQEPDVPLDVPVLYRDEHILVVDKPHGLPTTPRGCYVRNTALSHLRHTLQQPDLAPAHRLDRLTAGVLVFTCTPTLRSRVQRQFHTRSVTKIYECVAKMPAGAAVADLATVRETRIEKPPGSLQAIELPGPVNAITRIEPVVPKPWTDSVGTWVDLRLHPATGKTHQLRVHLNALGAPIRNDPLYPVVTLGLEPDPSSPPLQLLARSLTMRHPISGDEMTFTSTRRLDTLYGARPPAASHSANPYKEPR